MEVGGQRGREAQSVLSEMNDASPFVRWTKEGRKYQLGSILVTQQPASIAPQLLSQGDNFFAFHLISAGDLEALQRVNAHFSRDVLTQLLNEPIRGNAYFWSAPHQPFVLSARIDSFERRYGNGGGVEEQAATALAETPAESFRVEHGQALTDFDHLVRETLGQTFSVKLRENPMVAGTVRGELLAANAYNLCKGLGEDARARQMEQSFFRETSQGPVAKDQPVLDALKRLGLLHGVEAEPGSRNRSQWLLLNRSQLELPENRRLFGVALYLNIAWPDFIVAITCRPRHGNHGIT